MPAADGGVADSLHVGTGRSGGLVGARIDEYSRLARLRAAEGHGGCYREREPSAQYFFRIVSLKEMEVAGEQLLIDKQERTITAATARARTHNTHAG